ncbi:MAG: universal stress protein [Labilithrix sp.]|nr:universal stress protein [Labilithrix sp.]MCW5813117.1 universal stress protein [Labilithrix sp.]
MEASRENEHERVNEKGARPVVLAAIDRSLASDEVIEAGALAARSRDGELHLVHVLPPPTFPSGPAIPPVPSLVEDGRVFLQNMRDVAERSFTGPLAVHLATGDAHDQITALAADLGADLIVAGAPAKSALTRLLHGSVAHRLANDAPCAVLVARPRAREDAPAIEPPCQACLEARRQSGGERMWCEHHARPHAQARLHYAVPPSFGRGSMFLEPRQ